MLGIEQKRNEMNKRINEKYAKSNKQQIQDRHTGGEGGRSLDMY